MKKIIYFLFTFSCVLLLLIYLPKMFEYQIMFFDWNYKVGFFHELVYLLIPLVASIIVVYYISTKEQLIKKILRMLVGFIFGFILGTFVKGIISLLFFVPGMVLFTSFEESSLINKIPNFLIHEVPFLCAILGLYLTNIKSQQNLTSSQYNAK